MRRLCPRTEQFSAEADDGPAVQDSSEIVITGSRVSRSGADQPTPVQVLSAGELLDSSPNIVQALTSLPQLAQSLTLASPGNIGGISFMNLRGLGPQRTLVLMNGRRLTPATVGPSPDVNSLPLNIVQRVDIVTGGASAAYGSDAVAGVVNVILDTKLKGIRGTIQSGVTSRGDDANYMLSLAAGTGFAGDRGNIVISGELFDTRGVLGTRGRDWARKDYQPLPNPRVTAANPGSPTNPNIIIVPNSGWARSFGGVILGGPLNRIHFGEGGTVLPNLYDEGQLHTFNFQQGGDYVSVNPDVPLSATFNRKNAYARATFDISDSVTAYVEGLYAESQTYNRTLMNNISYTIFSGNAFLPPSIQSEMNRLGLQTITVGRISRDLYFVPENAIAPSRQYGGGVFLLDDRTKTYDVSAGLSGSLGVGDLKWDGYYQHGNFKYDRYSDNVIIPINMFAAVDAVTVTAANQGTSGLPIGSIVCRTTLTLPTNGCVPLNIFGDFAASEGAFNYITGLLFFKQESTQNAAALNVQGTLFSTWAGPVRAAVGVEWRKMHTTQIGDPLSGTLPADYIAANHPGVRGVPANFRTNNRGALQFGNYQPIDGKITVKEYYGEAVVPLADESPFVHSLEVNGAVRYADYSSTGGEVTWKVGAVYEPTRGVRLRATRSRDIRAPSVVELFSSARQLPVTIRDPITNSSYTVNTFQTGNLDLQAEKADTTTLGIVLQPRFLPGITLSIDAYDIKIAEAITVVPPQGIIDECIAGNTEFCGFITRDSANTIIRLTNPNVNLATVQQRGVDFELGYTGRLGAGKISMRGFATYVDKLAISSFGSNPTIDRAGQVGVGAGGTAGSTTLIGGVPKWAGQATLDYERGPFSFIVQERFVGGGKYDNTFDTDKYNAPGVPITYISDNDIKGRAYTAVTLKYRLEDFGGQMEMYGIVNNLFDQDPPIAPALAGNMPQTNAALYDVLGRRYTVGLRMKF